MYKIVTLGENFLFLRERDAEKHKYDGSQVIVKADEECDFCFWSENTCFTREDFSRAVSVYMSKVVGLPSSVYTVRTNYGKLSVSVPKKSEEIFGGDLNKCKLLFTDVSCEDKNGGVSLYTALTPLGKIKIALCDSLSDFDIERVGKLTFRAEGVRDFHSFLAISVCEASLSIRSFFPTGNQPADALSYAAAYCCAYALGYAKDEMQIHCAEDIALCRRAFGGALVFDKSPSVMKIIL